MQWGFCGSPILLPTGESEPWRRWTAGGLFFVCFLVPVVALPLLALLALVLRG